MNGMPENNVSSFSLRQDTWSEKLKPLLICITTKVNFNSSCNMQSQVLKCTKNRKFNSTMIKFFTSLKIGRSQLTYCFRRLSLDLVFVAWTVRLRVNLSLMDEMSLADRFWLKFLQRKKSTFHWHWVGFFCRTGVSVVRPV